MQSSKFSPASVFPLSGRRIRPTLAALFFLVLGWLAAAGPAEAAYYHLYVSGPLGGSIEVDNGPQPPAGTCGARFNNPYYWYWAAGDYSETGEMQNLPGNGQAAPYIRLTGQFAATCSPAAYLATTPASPSGIVPIGAISLVVDIDADDVEWLDHNDNPIPEGPPEIEPHVFDPCEIADFCENITTGGLCVTDPDNDLCTQWQVGEGLAVRMTDLAASIPAQVAAAHRYLAAGRRADATLALNLARTRAGKALAQLVPLRQRQVAINRAVGLGYPSIGAAISLGHLSASYEIGAKKVDACDKALLQAQKAMQANRTPAWTSLHAACDPIGPALSRTQPWFGRLLHWALPR